MADRQARVGIIGVGWWGTLGHLEPLTADPRAEVVAVWSRTEDKAKDRAARYGVERHYTDYRRLIDECALDGVIIASTPNVHYEQARYALEHGLHVLVEKPFVLHAEEAVALQQVAQAQGRLLSICHPILYDPMMVEARRQVRSGALGNVVAASALFSQRTYELFKGEVSTHFRVRGRPDDMPRPNDRSYSDPAIAGGGEGHTQASHIIGAVLWITGLRPASVFAYMNRLDLAVDVTDAMTIRFANGALVTIVANGLLPARCGARLLHIQGNRGILNMDSLSATLHVQTEDDARPRQKSLDAPAPGDSRAAVPRSFVRAVLGEEELYVETDVAVNEVRILESAYRSATSGQEVSIDG